MVHALATKQKNNAVKILFKDKNSREAETLRVHLEPFTQVATMLCNVDILVDPNQNMHNIQYIPENHFQITSLYQKTAKKQC